MLGPYPAFRTGRRRRASPDRSTELHRFSLADFKTDKAPRSDVRGKGPGEAKTAAASRSWCAGSGSRRRMIGRSRRTVGSVWCEPATTTRSGGTERRRSTGRRSVPEGAGDAGGQGPPREGGFRSAQSFHDDDGWCYQWRRRARGWRASGNASARRGELSGVQAAVPRGECCRRARRHAVGAALRCGECRPGLRRLRFPGAPRETGGDAQGEPSRGIGANSVYVAETGEDELETRMRYRRP